MELISNLTDSYLEKFKVLKEEKEPRLFEIKSAFIREKICPTCARKLKISRKGDYFCSRKTTKCKVFIRKETMK